MTTSQLRTPVLGSDSQTLMYIRVTWETELIKNKTSSPTPRNCAVILDLVVEAQE